MTIQLAGVGGQGVILAGNILADAAFVSGYDVKKSEVHGLSRRFGSVTCQVRLNTPSPCCGHAAADLLVALEAREGLRQLPFLRATGMALVNRLWIGENTRHSTDDPRVDWIDGSIRVRELGGPPAGLNLYMLGAVAGLLPLCDDAWCEAISCLSKPKALSSNLALFAYARRCPENTTAKSSRMEVST